MYGKLAAKITDVYIHTCKISSKLDELMASFNKILDFKEDDMDLNP